MRGDERGRPRLVYLHQYFCPPGGPGGSRSWEFSNRLVDDGWDVTMLTGDSELAGADPAAVEAAYAGRKGRFTLRALPLAYRNQMSYARRVFAFVSFAVRSSVALVTAPACDLVFATSTPLTVAVPALLRRWVRGTPYVFEVRDLWPEMPVAVGALRSRPLVRLAEFLERTAYRNAAAVIALSPGMKEGVVRRGVPESAVTVVPNACDNKRFRVDRAVGSALRRARPELGEGPLVVYAGTFGRLNGVSYLARLAAATATLRPDVTFAAVGSGAEEEMVRAEAARLGVLDVNFRLLGPLPKKEIPALFSAATVVTSLFVPIPEMEHNSANKFFDGLSAGRPLLINYGGWQREILLRSGAGISVSATDPAAAARDLVALLDDPARLEAASAAAARLADSDFDRDTLYRTFAAVLEKAARPSSPADGPGAAPGAAGRPAVTVQHE